MKKQDISQNIRWDENGIGYIKMNVPIFNGEIQFELFSDEDKIEPSISAKMFDTIEDVLNLPLTSIEKIKQLLWEECNYTFTVGGYGCEPKQGETVKEACFREFNVQNAEDYYRNSHIKGVQIQFESDKLAGRYAEIKIKTAIDNLISIIVKNGAIIDLDDDGTYLGWFETDEQKAHNWRMKILNE